MRDPRIDPMPPADSINAQIATLVMGWTVVSSMGMDFVKKQDNAWNVLSTCPDFEHSLDACHLAEQKIMRRGLMNPYVDVIYDHMGYNSTNERLAKKEVEWLVFMFSPEERCQVMLETVREATREATERADWLAAHLEGEKNG